MDLMTIEPLFSIDGRVYYLEVKQTKKKKVTTSMIPRRNTPQGKAVEFWKQRAVKFVKYDIL